MGRLLVSVRGAAGEKTDGEKRFGKVRSKIIKSLLK